MGLLRKSWNPPGPVAARFMASTKPIQAILGPVGSGKTSAALMKLVKLGRQQKPSPRDGVRRFRCCVVRDTYRQLWKTTIKSWFDWIPKHAGTWTGSNDSPSIHRILMALADGTTLDFEIHFIAIGDNNVKDVLSGYEATAFYLNEADLMSEEVLMYVRTRAGRYPKMDDGGPTWYGVLIDFNAPDIDNYLYGLLVENPLSNVAFFRQPGGDTAAAENLKNLPPDYYQTLALGQPDWVIRRTVKALFGYSRDGKPVYMQFNETRHVANHIITPIRGRLLTIGVDAGRTPAAMLIQRRINGQWLILRELIREGIDADGFGEALARLMYEEFTDWDTTKIEGFGDPAASFAGDQDARTWLEIFSKASGIKFRPAPCSNKDLVLRRDSISKPLKDSVEDGQPAFLISNCCRVFIKGMASHYRYRRIKVAGTERYEDKAEKNPWSHPIEAGQYGIIGAGGAHEVLGRKKASANGVRQTAAITDQNPRGTYGPPPTRPRTARMD